MALILISEPNADVRRLLEHMVCRLGHEPRPVATLTRADLAAADALIVEPADAACALLACFATSLRRTLPVVCISIAPPLGNLGVAPTAHLLKPFGLDELRAALDTAVSAGDA